MVASVSTAPPLTTQFHGLADFPVEVQTHLLCFFTLEPHKVAFCIASVCKTWNQIAKDTELITRAKLFRLEALADRITSPSDRAYALLSVAEGAIEKKLFKEAAFYLDRAKKIIEDSELKDVIKERLRLYEIQTLLPEANRKGIVQELKNTISKAFQTPANTLLPLSVPGVFTAPPATITPNSSLAYHCSKEIIHTALRCGIDDELLTLLERIPYSEDKLLKTASALGLREIVNLVLKRLSKNGKTAIRPVSFRTSEEMQESFDDLLKRSSIDSYLDSLIEAREHILKAGFLDLFKKSLLKIEAETKGANKAKIYQTLIRQWIEIGELDNALELAQVLISPVGMADLDHDPSDSFSSRRVYLEVMAALIASGQKTRAVEAPYGYHQYLQGVVYFMQAEHQAHHGDLEQAFQSISEGEKICRDERWHERIKDELRDYHCQALEAVVFAYAKASRFQEAFDLISKIKEIKFAQEGFLLNKVEEAIRDLIDRLIVDLAPLGIESWQVTLKYVDDTGRKSDFTLWDYLSQKGKILVAQKLIECNEFKRAQLYLQYFLALDLGDSEGDLKDIETYLKVNLETPRKIGVHILVVLANYATKAKDQNLLKLCLSFTGKILENQSNLMFSHMHSMLELVEIGCTNSLQREAETIVDLIIKHPNRQDVFWDLVRVSFEIGYYRGAYQALKSIPGITADRRRYRQAILAFFRTIASKSHQHNS